MIGFDDAAEFFSAADFTDHLRLEVFVQNPVIHAHSLMRSTRVVVCKPLPADVVKLRQAEADEDVQTLGFAFSN